jgi:hypothetical protein
MLLTRIKSILSEMNIGVEFLLTELARNKTFGKIARQCSYLEINTTSVIHNENCLRLLTILIPENLKFL